MELSLGNLRSCLMSMRNRNAKDIHTYQKQSLLGETNALLKDGLVSALIKSIIENAEELKAKKQFDSETAVTFFTMLRMKAEILFYVFLRTQITKSEAVELIELIRKLSNMVMFDGYLPTEDQSWKTPIYSLIVVLQLAHVNALQQTVFLLSRNDKYAPDTNMDALEIGNNLENVSKSREGVDENVWACDGAKGFACLVYAVFRQPEVDMDRASPEDVEWFMFEACLLRAYSYIRLCMLPVLQVSYLQGKRAP
jgi:hypothetical protein